MSARIRTAVICLGILAVGLAGFLGLKATKPTPPEKEATRVRPIVRVMEVKTDDFRATIEENGTVEPKTTLEITAEVAGRIVYVSNSLRVGFFVKEGELLIEVDPREYRLSVAQSKAELAQLAAELAKIDQERQNIGRNIEVEKDKLALARSELERKKKLLASGSLSQSEVDKQEIDTKQQEVSLVNQQNALALLKSQKDLVQAKIDSTQAKKEIAKLKLEKTKIFAPFNGRIHDESVEEGHYVQVGQKLATIYDTSAMEVVVNFSPTKTALWISEETREDFPPLNDLGQVNLWMEKYGPPAKVTFAWAGRTRTWSGKVSRLKGALDAATRTVPIVVEVKDPFKDISPGKSPPLVPGMFVDVVIEGALLKNVARIPRSALHNADSVYVVSDGKLEIRKVHVKMVTRNEAIISKGLKEGDKVIVSPVSVPIPGAELRIVDES
ncbi:MAG: efflux RND transporter periplasmic adaptor subunit [Desulfomonilaceae bacterium]|nr:efflux RND transporter periplasmic adaptor subunit [Desulfomonilaceae bacterium]